MATPDTEIVDLALSAFEQMTAGVPPESWPIMAEAVVARIVEMTEQMLLTPSGRPSRRAQRQLWADIAAELAARTDVNSLALTAGLRRQVAAEFRPEFERVWALRCTGGEPAWVDRIADVRLTEAFLTLDLAGDGYNVVFGFDDGGEGHTVVLYVDNNLGGIAKDVFPGPPVEVVRATYRDNPEIVIRAATVPGAIGLALTALERTGEAPPGCTSRDFDEFVALLELRLAEAGIAVEWPEPPPRYSKGARAVLLHEFLVSEHAAELGLAPELVEAIARLWLDYAVDETVGGPLRVSAVLVELFMADWVPRLPAPRSPEFLLAVPEVVRAWLRFAADHTPVPRSLLQDASAAIERWAPVMRQRCQARSTSPPVRPDVPDDDDDLEALWFTLPDLGRAPVPDVGGLDPARAGRLVALARGSWLCAGERLGTDFAGRAFALAERLVHEAPELVDGAQLRTLTFAVLWLIAEDEGVVGRAGAPGLVPASQFAEELGTTVKTMRRKVDALRQALDRR